MRIIGFQFRESWPWLTTRHVGKVISKTLGNVISFQATYCMSSISTRVTPSPLMCPFKLTTQDISNSMLSLGVYFAARSRRQDPRLQEQDHRLFGLHERIALGQERSDPHEEGQFHQRQRRATHRNGRVSQSSETGSKFWTTCRSSKLLRGSSTSGSTWLLNSFYLLFFPFFFFVLFCFFVLVFFFFQFHI